MRRRGFFMGAVGAVLGLLPRRARAAKVPMEYGYVLDPSRFGRIAGIDGMITRDTLAEGIKTNVCVEEASGKKTSEYVINHKTWTDIQHQYTWPVMETGRLRGDVLGRWSEELGLKCRRFENRNDRKAWSFKWIITQRRDLVPDGMIYFAAEPFIDALRRARSAPMFRTYVDGYYAGNPVHSDDVEILTDIRIVSINDRGEKCHTYYAWKMKDADRKRLATSWSVVLWKAIKY